MTPDTIDALNRVAGSLSVPGVLLIAIFATWWVMSKHHSEVVKQLRDENERGWQEADKARAELSANNAVLDKVNDSFKDLTRSILDLSSRLPGKR